MPPSRFVQQACLLALFFQLVICSFCAQEGKNQVAYEMYTQAASVDPLNDNYNAIILCNR